MYTLCAKSLHIIGIYTLISEKRGGKKMMELKTGYMLSKKKVPRKHIRRILVSKTESWEIENLNEAS